MLKLQSSLKATCMAVAALAALSCSQDELANQLGLKGNTTIVASFEGTGSGTRTSVNELNQVVWNKDDAFGLFYTSATQQTPKPEKFSCPDADGTSTSAKFVGTPNDNITVSYAVYPYDKDKKDGDMSLNGTTVSMTLPADFNYTKASNGPMYAPAADYKTKSLEFKHLAGLLKLTISKGIDDKAKKFIITADKSIAGTCTADLNTASPVLAVTADGSTTINVTLPEFNDDGQGNITTFYIPIPVGTYATLSATLSGEDGAALYPAKEWTDVTVERSDILTASFGYVTIDGGTSTSKLTNDIAAALPNSTTPPATPTTTNLQITGTIDATKNAEPIKIPIVQNSNINMALATVPTTSESNPLKLEDTQGSAEPTANAVNTMTFAIPKAEASNAPSLTITMPQTTVELDASGNDGTTYNKVIALTANNTLVIKKGVTVKDLTVKGGNVRVSGKIEAISKDKGLTTTSYLITEAEAKLPTTTTGFTVIDAETYDLMMAAKNGGTYTLNSDVILSEPLVVEKTMTLDLNGHSIKPAAEGLKLVLNTKDAVVLVRRGAQLTVNDSSSNKQGSIDTNSNAAILTAVKLTDSNDEKGENASQPATLIVNGGTIKGSSYGICGNGTRHNTSITINGGNIEAADAVDGTGIYHPQDGILTVNGGTISGHNSGIEIRAGKLEVKGGTIKHTATTFKKAANGNGTTITGAAVAVSQHTTNKALNVTISGGELQGGDLYALYEEDLQDENASGISMKVNGGKLYGQVFSENCPACISGGTFSDTSALNYLTENANVNVNLNKDNEITALYIPKNQSIAMDLNSKKLTIKTDAIPATIDVEGKVKKNINVLISGSLILKNGSIENNKAGMALTTNNAKLELDNITYTTINPGHYGIFNDPNIEGSSITVKNSNINSVYYAINTNALANPVGSTTITLVNSTFTAKETPLMVNIPATVTSTGCTFNGGWQGVFLRGATTTFTDSHINLVFASDYATSNIAQGSTWKSGNQAPAAALTAGNRSTSAYDYKTKITLNNTTFSNSGTEKDGKEATNYPAIYIDTESASSKPNQGVELSYDATSENSFKVAGQGLVIGNKDNVKINGSMPQ